MPEKLNKSIIEQTKADVIEISQEIETLRGEASSFEGGIEQQLTDLRERLQHTPKLTTEESLILAALFQAARIGASGIDSQIELYQNLNQRVEDSRGQAILWFSPTLVKNDSMSYMETMSLGGNQRIEGPLPQINVGILATDASLKFSHSPDRLYLPLQSPGLIAQLNKVATPEERLSRLLMFSGSRLDYSNPFTPHMSPNQVDVLEIREANINFQNTGVSVYPSFIGNGEIESVLAQPIREPDNRYLIREAIQKLETESHS